MSSVYTFACFYNCFCGGALSCVRVGRLRCGVHAKTCIGHMQDWDRLVAGCMAGRPHYRIPVIVKVAA